MVWIARTMLVSCSAGSQSTSTDRKCVVAATYKCSGWGIKPFRGEDDLYDLGLTKPAREESTFCKVTDALRIKRSDETWGFLNGIYQSNDKSLMAKTQARFLDCFRLCGSTASIAYYRNKRCNKFMLMLPSLLSDTGKVNLYSGELNPAANKTITDMSWSLQQACSRGACIYQLASSLLLQLGFSSSVESKEGISTLLFDSTVNEVPIFRDLAGFVAMNQEGTVNIYVDNDIQKITPGTAFAQMMEAIFLYNRRVSSVAVTMQQSSIPGVSRCAQFNTMLENFLPVASIRACGTGREILPSWTCTEESISANYTPARVPTATYYGGAHTYILASYNAVTVTSGTEAGTLINSGGPRAEYRFPVALDADSLRIRIPYSSLQLVNSNQTLSTSLITAAAQAPVLSITRTPLLRRLASTFSGFNKITGNVATSSNAMTVTFPLLGRGFIGETNVTAAVFFQISYGSL
ncbi:hypothetical protein DFS34DRAFT_482406 [Phlyctochytrium arcticum]|nr:hypothetical protein DFS34DRAFT_482406 [Phlyctochytrium arcticum]